MNLTPWRREDGTKATPVADTRTAFAFLQQLGALLRDPYAMQLLSSLGLGILLLALVGLCALIGGVSL